MACSSANVERNSSAIYVTRVEDAELREGIELGVYVMSRTLDEGFEEDVIVFPGLS